jgi:hypothetical protein
MCSVSANADVEKMIARIAGMDRKALVEHLKGLECPFDLDFTEDFLGSVSLERLRHIALAATLHARRSKVKTQCA